MTIHRLILCSHKRRCRANGCKRPVTSTRSTVFGVRLCKVHRRVPLTIEDLKPVVPPVAREEVRR